MAGTIYHVQVLRCWSQACSLVAHVFTCACCTGATSTEAWEAVRDALMPAVKACILPGSWTGWHDAGDACLQAEPICEALSLYHLLLSREAQHSQSLTGLPCQQLCILSLG